MISIYYTLCFFSSRRRHTRCALVTGVQTCALPICKTTADVVVVELSDTDGNLGRGEAVPYAHYGESLQSVLDQIESLHGALAEGLDRHGLQALLPAGAARNAVDLAFWDLECKQSGRRHWEIAGLPPPAPVTTAFTPSLDSAEAMGRKAAENSARPLLKLKLAGPDDPNQHGRAPRRDRVGQK